VQGEGPIRDPSELESVLRGAVEDVRGGACVVVDVWTQNRTLDV
jgi:hypothetical protein